MSNTGVITDAPCRDCTQIDDDMTPSVGAKETEPKQLESDAGEFDPLTREDGLTVATISSGMWRSVSVFGGAAMQFAVSVVLARLLAPADFGTLALVMVVTGVSNSAIITGLGYPIIQRRELRREHLQTAWTLSLLAGLIGTGVVATGAPWLARLLGDARSAGVFMCLSPLILLTATQVCSLSLLRRKLLFKQLMLRELISYAIGYGPVALAGAALGWGIWSLVAGSLIQAVLLAILAYWFVRHPVRLRLERAAARDILGLGGMATASALTSFVALNGDNLVVGRLLGTASLGFYTRAYHLMTLPLAYFAQILSQVLLPAYSRVQQEPLRMGRAYIVSIYTAFWIAAPTMMFVLVAAPHLVPGLYGDGWEGAIKPLQVLAVFGGLRALYHLGGPLAQGSGRPGREFLRQLMYAALVILGAVIGSRWGLTGVAWGIGCAITAMYFAMAHLSHAVAHFCWARYAAAHMTGFVAGIAMLALGLLVRHLLIPVELPNLVLVTILGLLLVLVTFSTICLVPRGLRPEGAEQAFRIVLGRLPPCPRALGLRLLRLG